MNDFFLLLSRIPPDAFPAMGRLVTALLSGDHAAAEREARVTSETIAAKKAVHAAFAAGAAGHKPNTGT